MTYKNIVEPGRPQMKIWRIASWLPKATKAHSEYVIFFFFPPQEWLHKHAIMLHYSFVACLVLYIFIINGNNYLKRGYDGDTTVILTL